MRARALAPVGVVATAAPAISGLWALCAWEARRARGGERPYVDALDGTARIGAGLNGAPGAHHLDRRQPRRRPRLRRRGRHPGPPRRSPARAARRRHDARRPRLEGLRRHRQPARPRRPLHRPRRAVRRRQRRGDLGGPQRVRRADRPASSPRWRRSRWSCSRCPTSPWPTAWPSRCAASPAPAAATSKPPAPRSPPATTTWCRSTSPAGPPASPARAGRRMLCADRFHPGAEGYRLWAERIATACSDMLEPPRSPFHPSMYA